MTGKDYDAASIREDPFLAELIPQVTEHLAEQYGADYDAEAGRTRFLTWLAAHMEKPVAPANRWAGSYTSTSAPRAEQATTRKPSTGLRTKPRKPIFYGPVARLADRFAGRGDGSFAVPFLPGGSVDGIDSQVTTTPYLEIRWRHFLGNSEREHRHMLTDLEPVYRQLAMVRQEIKESMEKVTEARQRLEAIPGEPSDAALNTRYSVEEHPGAASVRAQRRGEHDVKRERVLAKLEQAVARVRALGAEEARLSGMITAREETLGARVRQLHEHTLRRCGTYRHHLVRKHPDGVALIPYLNLALPTLPGRASADDHAGRYMHIPEIDRWRAVPFDMPPDPERGTVLQRVRQITESLDGAIDEGTGGALDRLIESWVAAWIATVETDYADHCAVINVHRGQASQWLIESTRTAQHENEELERIRAAYLACRARLALIRLARKYRQQARKVAKAKATVDRARAAIEHAAATVDRGDHRRRAAVTERQMLGAEAANYARVLMAAMLQDRQNRSDGD